MPIKVSPTTPEHIRTHHISLTDKNGQSLGLILVDSNGTPQQAFARNPVDRTSFKTASGSMTYSDFDYPYTPISQDNFSGGRGNQNFEKASDRFLDSYRMRTSRANLAFLGPQEQYTNGYRGLDQACPGSVVFKALQGSTKNVAKKFPASSSYTGVNVWLLLKRVGTPGSLTVGIMTDNLNTPQTALDELTITADILEDVLSEWIINTMSAAMTSATSYWIEVTASATDDASNHWEIGVKNSLGTSKHNDGGWISSDFDLYFRVTDADAVKKSHFYTYAEQQYLVVSGTSGAPKLYMNGDRGAADSNHDYISELIDATKSWTTDQWKGAICVIVGGTGRTEERPYRVIGGNGSESLYFYDDPWTVEQDTTTEYVIIGSDIWQEITGHGLTAPVTDVLVSSMGVVYFAQGDSVAIRRHRAYNNSGTWTNEWADDSTNKATFLIQAPQSMKVWKANNLDASSVVSVASEDPQAWGTDLTFDTAKPIGSKYDRITGLEMYLDDDGAEALWVGKETRPWIVPASVNPYPISLREMETVRSPKNCLAMTAHNVYIYMSLMDGLEQYYEGNLSDIGPNLDEGLPEDRQGPIVSLLGYPGKIFAAVDAGAAGYSSVLVRDGGGWHEHYRAPLGQRITALYFQVIPGGTLNRMWVYQGNDVIWIPFPIDTTNELEDSDYPYTHEGVLELSRMHAGMMDTLKLVKLLKLMTDNLVDEEQWIEADYRVDSDTEWTPFPLEFVESPVQAVSLAEASQDKVTYGVAGKRLMLRLRFYTKDASKTPKLLALVLEVVSRITVKKLYSLSCRIADNDSDLQGHKDDLTADQKFSLLDEWISDAASSMLLMRSIEPNYDSRLVFLQPYGDRDKNMAKTPEDDNHQNRTYLITLVAQDA